MYAKKGNTVYAIGRSREKMSTLPKENIVPLCADISREKDWDNIIVPAVNERGGKLNIVIACASMMHIGNAEKCTLNDWEKVCAINLTGQFLTANKTLRFLKEAKGNILFIGSPSAKLAVRDEVCYITFKHAICGLSKSIAFDFGADGVRSNVAHPGWMRTAMSDKEMEEIMEKDKVSLDEAYKIATRFVPMKRPGSLEEICSMIESITSDASSYVTGAEFMIDGGLSIVDPGMVAF